MRRVAVAICGFALATAVVADTIYQEPATFLEEAFAGTLPPPQTIWFTGELRERARAILGHDPRPLRLRYWRAGSRTAWILEEIGKERPITIGVVVQDDRIERLRVLIYRESRGWEVHTPAFTAQFDTAKLRTDGKLDRGVDGITGATLSVQALTRLARLALLLDAHTDAPH